jgi:glutamate 5-kinase
LLEQDVLATEKARWLLQTRSQLPPEILLFLSAGAGYCAGKRLFRGRRFGNTPMIPHLTVIKAGTGVLTKSNDGTLDRAALVHLVSAIAGLIAAGHRCLFVSSGAVGSGVSALGLTEYPQDTATRQACAAVGQARLMQTYSSLFANFDIHIAQVLLTAADLATPERAGYVKDTLRRLLVEPMILPIINENDSVAVEELKFGDNDMLSVRVAKLAGAQRIILLTSVDGLLDPDQALIPEVTDVDDVLRHVRDEKGRFSMGGMASKLAAVKFAVDAGIETHIAHGRHPERLAGILAGKGISTRFHAAVRP